MRASLSSPPPSLHAPPPHTHTLDQPHLNMPLPLATGPACIFSLHLPSHCSSPCSHQHSPAFPHIQHGPHLNMPSIFTVKLPPHPALSLVIMSFSAPLGLFSNLAQAAPATPLPRASSPPFARSACDPHPHSPTHPHTYQNPT